MHKCSMLGYRAGNCCLSSNLHDWVFLVWTVPFQCPMLSEQQGPVQHVSQHCNTLLCTISHYITSPQLQAPATRCCRVFFSLWALMPVILGARSSSCHYYNCLISGLFSTCIAADVQGGRYQEGPMPFGNVPTHHYQPPTGLPSRRRALICGCNYRSGSCYICSLPFNSFRHRSSLLQIWFGWYSAALDPWLAW